MTEPEPALKPAPAARHPRRRIVLGLAGLGLLAAVGLWLTSAGGLTGNNGASAELTYEVKRGDLRISFTERGSVKALKSVPIYSHLEGPHTIVSLVPEGANVLEGDVLVELDSSEITQLLNQQQIQVETAEADLLNAQEQLEIQRSLGESEVEKAQLDWTLAELDLEKYLSPRGDYEIASTKAKGSKTIAQEELSRAQNKLDWTEKLAAKGYVTGTELISDRLAVNKARLQVEQADGELELLEKYTFKKEKAKYSSALSQAKQAHERARRKGRAELTQAEAAKKGKEATLNLSRKRLAKLQDQLEKTKVRAPQDGMVVYPNVEPWRRERMIMQGAEVHENQLLMNLPDVSTMAVDVQVHESWVDQVKEGLPALVGIDALPNLNLRGTVTRVGLLPDSGNRWMNPDLKVYQTQITLDEAPDVKLLRPGMSAKVEILIALLNDVLYVPVQAVSAIDKQQVCYLLEKGAFVPRPVQCGRYNDSFIEIVNGLNEGDHVQLTAPPPSGDMMDEGEPVDASIAARIQAAEKADKARASGEGGDPGSRRSRGGRDPSEEGRSRGGEGRQRGDGDRGGGKRGGDRLEGAAAPAPSPGNDRAAETVMPVPVKGETSGPQPVAHEASGRAEPSIPRQVPPAQPETPRSALPKTTLAPTAGSGAQ